MNKSDENESITWKDRLVSLVFIALVWLVVLLASELDYRSWEYSFWNAAIALGAWTATLGGFFALFAKDAIDQRWCRCFAFWPFPISLVVFLFLDSFQLMPKGRIWALIFQFFIFFFLHFIYFFKSRKEA